MIRIPASFSLRLQRWRSSAGRPRRIPSKNSFKRTFLIAVLAAEALKFYLPAEQLEPKNPRTVRIARQYRHLVSDVSSKEEKLRLAASRSNIRAPLPPPLTMPRRSSSRLATERCCRIRERRRRFRPRCESKNPYKAPCSICKMTCVACPWALASRDSRRDGVKRPRQRLWKALDHE